jgi:hypothetical protein
MLLKAEGRPVARSDSDSRSESPSVSVTPKVETQDDQDQGAPGNIRWKPKKVSEMSNMEYLAHYVK